MTRTFFRILKSNNLKCLPIIFQSFLKQQNVSITNHNLKFCEDVEDYNFKLLYKYYFEFQNSCVQPCDFLQYEGSDRPWLGWVSTPNVTEDCWLIRTINLVDFTSNNLIIPAYDQKIIKNWIFDRRKITTAQLSSWLSMTCFVFVYHQSLVNLF